MSLLESINKRNADITQEGMAAEQAAHEESQKPDATVQAGERRTDFSNAVAAGQDRELQDEPASTEEQEIYTQLELQLVDIINGPKSSQLFQIISAAQDPVEGIGQAAHDLIKLIDKHNQGVDREILAALGESAVEQLVQAYEEANPQVDLNDDQVAEAYAVGMKEWLESTPNDVDPDMQEYLASEPPAQL